MAKITTFKGYDSDSSAQRPDEKVLPNIVKARDSVPVKHPNCEGLGVRIVHPATPVPPVPSKPSNPFSRRIQDNPQFSTGTPNTLWVDIPSIWPIT